MPHNPTHPNPQQKPKDSTRKESSRGEKGEKRAKEGEMGGEARVEEQRQRQEVAQREVGKKTKG